MIPYQFSKDDKLIPIYCIGCRTHIPRAVSNAQRGMCNICWAKLQAPSVPPPVQPQPMQQPPPGYQQPFQQPMYALPHQGYYQQQPKKGLPIVGWIALGIFGTCGICLLFPMIAMNNSIDNARNSAPKPMTEQEKKEAAAQVIEEQQQAQELLAEEAVRGKRPTNISNFPTDAIRNYLRHNLRDPKSLDMEGCSGIGKYDKDAWYQTCTYRAKNGFNGLNLVTQMFVIRNDVVIDVMDE